MKLGKALPFKISIEAAGNGGFLVRIGCETYAYGHREIDKQEMLTDISAFVTNPKKCIQEYNGQLEEIEGIGMARLSQKRFGGEKESDCRNQPR